MKGVIYEDEKCNDLLPLVWMRPVYDLVCGAMTLRQRMERQLPDVDFVCRTRPHLGRRATPGRKHGILFVNGRLLGLGPSLRSTLARSEETERALFVDGQLAAVALEPEASKAFISSGFAEGSLPKDVEVRQLEAPTRMIDHCWDLIASNGEALAEDLSLCCLPERNRTICCGSYILGDDLYCAPRVKIEPFCLFDTRSGPVFLDQGVEVRSHTVIRGPAFIGEGSTLLGGEIGPEAAIMEGCKVHGDFQSSIMMAHSNMCHQGLIAHSYISEWVNVGSGACVSDLKNTYGSIRVRIDDRMIDTGLTKLGCFIADHAKLSVGSLIYPGKSIGVASHVHGTVTENVPSFTIWGNGLGAKGATILLESAIRTRKRMMGRRQIEPDQRGDELLRRVYRRTEGERRRKGVHSQTSQVPQAT